MGAFLLVIGRVRCSQLGIVAPIRIIVSPPRSADVFPRPLRVNDPSLLTPGKFVTRRSRRCIKSVNNYHHVRFYQMVGSRRRPPKSKTLSEFMGQMAGFLASKQDVKTTKPVPEVPTKEDLQELSWLSSL